MPLQEPDGAKKSRDHNAPLRGKGAQQARYFAVIQQVCHKLHGTCKRFPEFGDMNWALIGSCKAVENGQWITHASSPSLKVLCPLPMLLEPCAMPLGRQVKGTRVARNQASLF